MLINSLHSIRRNQINMRSPRKLILLSLFSFTIIIFIFSLFIKFDIELSTVLDIRYVSPSLSSAKSSPSKPCVKDLFQRYWKPESKNDPESLLLGSIEEVRAKFAQTTIDPHEQLQTKRNSKQHLIDYLKSPQIEPFDFSKCRLSNCFDFSRCHDASLKVYIVPKLTKEPLVGLNITLGESNQIHANILKIIRDSKYFEPDPQKACLFVLEDDTLDRDPLSQSFRPELTNIFNERNNYGMNHLIFNLYSGSWPEYSEDNFAGLQFGAAMLAKASNSVLHHRPGFDISLPLFSYLHPYSDSSINEEKPDYEEKATSLNRTYFLTFKGKRYVSGSGSETRNSLYHLNNQRDVIMLTTCRHGKKWRDSSDGRCLDDESSYDQFDFVDLMRKSTFCLIPRGRRLGSFRYLEAMKYGCIPVILSDGWIKPFDEIIDWSCSAIQFEENLLLQVPDILRDVDEQTISNMRESCLLLYEKYFSTIEKIILSTLHLIDRRLKNSNPNSF